MHRPHAWLYIVAVVATASPFAAERAEHAGHDEIEEIVVTGSHLHRSHLVSSSPVTDVDADELLFQGTVRVEDMVRTLPQVFSGQNTSQSNGATGTANLNLRNLGTLRNRLRVVWTTRWKLTATAMWRYLDEAEDRSLAGADLGSVSYIDLAGIWNVTGKIEVRAGMNNVFDEEPPIVVQAAGPSIFGNGNTFPGLYDALGRYWFAAVGLSL